MTFFMYLYYRTGARSSYNK